MADFFTRLAQRALGAAAVARPAIAPLFAPGPEIAPEPAAAPASRLKPVSLSPAPAVRAKTFPSPETGPARVLPVKAPAPTAQVANGEAAPVSVAELHERREAGLPPSQRTRRDRDRQPITTRPELPVAADSARPEPARELALDAGIPRHPTLPDAPLESERAAPPAVPVGRRETRAAETPAVRVSIGRIEVRAVYPDPPAPPPAAPREPHPVLSLADYLKQRDGGLR